MIRHILVSSIYGFCGVIFFRIIDTILWENYSLLIYIVIGEIVRYS